MRRTSSRRAGWSPTRTRSRSTHARPPRAAGSGWARRACRRAACGSRRWSGSRAGSTCCSASGPRPPPSAYAGKSRSSRCDSGPTRWARCRRRASVPHPFLERLSRGPVLADGAMGTMLYSRGIPYEQCFDEINVTQPDLVQQIHREYIAAGAELIETNTFDANRIRLSMYGLEDRVRELNRRAVKNAREAREIAGEPVFVAGSIGPVDKPMEPVGPLSLYDVRLAFREQVEALVEGGVDLLVLETFYDLAEITEAVLAVRETTDLPLVAQMTFNEDRHIASGATVAEVVQALERLGVDVIGLNCGVGPASALDVVRELIALTHLPVSVQPNAGLPARVGGRLMYVSTPDYHGEMAARFAAAGARLIGGCCGTTQ